MTTASTETNTDPASDLQVVTSESTRLQRLTERGHRWLGRFQAFKERAPKLIAFLRLVYYPLALAFVGYIAYKASNKIDFATIRYWPLLASYGFALVWWLSLAFGWSNLISEDTRIGPTANWCRTQVARYFPGGFWAPVARATTVEGRVRDKVAAVVAENVIVLCVALGIGALWASVHSPIWIPLVVVAFLPLLATPLLEKRSQVTRKGVMRAAALYAFGFASYGAAGVMAQIAFSGVHTPTYPLYVAGATCVAWAMGLIVVFAPSGFGVREAVYIWMLSGLSYKHADLEGAAIASRLVNILAELTVLAIVTRPQLHRRSDAKRAVREADPQLS